MIKKEQAEKFATTYGITGEEREAYIKAVTEAEVVEITIPEGIQVFTPETLTTFKTNLVEQSRAGVIERAVREFGKAKGLDDKVVTFESLYSTIETNAAKEAGKEPEAKYKTLETKYLDIVKAKEKIEAESTAKIDGLQNSLFINTVKSKALNGLKSDTSIPKDDVFTLMTLKKATPFKTEKGIIGAKDAITGDVMQDDHLNPIPFVDVFNKFVDENYSKKIDTTVVKKGIKDKDGVLTFASMSAWEAHFAADMTTPEATKSLEASVKLSTFKA